MEICNVTTSSPDPQVGVMIHVVLGVERLARGKLHITHKPSPAVSRTPLSFGNRKGSLLVIL